MLNSFKTVFAAATVATLGIAAPAYADEAPASDITITGSATIATEYRLRGISQTDSRAAIQGGITVAHSSGVYVGTWASNLGGNGTWGGSNMELDLIGGYSKSFSGVTADAGLVYYVYPGTSKHDYIEVYGSLSAPIGPVKAKVGTYWTPSQKNVAAIAAKGHNIWVYGELAAPIPSTPVTLKGHLGYSSGNSIYTCGAGFGPCDKNVLDYSIGADFTYKALTLNVSYVGTDMSSAAAGFNFNGGVRSGHTITKGAVVASLTAAF
ncbi:MAG: TorF family putative porin [Novosphingobium sp.]